MKTKIQNPSTKIKKAKLQELEENVVQGLKELFEKWQSMNISDKIDSSLIELLLRKSVVSSQYVMIQYMLPLKDEEKVLSQFFEKEQDILKKQLDAINTTIHNCNHGIIG